jgi:Fe-S-cluster containining protein
MLTEGDKARVAAYTGRADFWELRAPSDPSYASQDDDPNWVRWGFYPDGTRPVLERRANGDCMFLGEAGCTLPLETRPLICRLFPYQYTEAGLEEAAGCPAEVIPPGSDMLTMLGMVRRDAERWHAQLYEELAACPRSVVEAIP